MSNLATVSSEQSWTPEQMKLITDVVAKGATPDELKLFLYRCHNLGLDPLKPGQIYFIKYGTGPGTIVVGIEGFRSRAARTGKLSGIKRGAIKDDKGVLLGAFSEVYRSDWKECAREEVPLAEYNTGKGNWLKMPETMIKKVAEAAALRMAFPDDLGGVYTKEEMDQAEQDSHRIAPEQPDKGDGAQEEGVEIKYGPCARQLVHRADISRFKPYLQEEWNKWITRGLDSPPVWARPMMNEVERIYGNIEEFLDVYPLSSGQGN